MLHDKLEDLSLCRKYSDAKHLLKCVDTKSKYCFPVQINLVSKTFSAIGRLSICFSMVPGYQMQSYIYS